MFAASTTGPGSDRPHILFLSDERGWPIRSGYRRRTAQIVSTLAALGPTTWVLAPRNLGDDGGPVDVPAELAIDATLVPAPTRSRPDTAWRWLTTGLPWPLAAGDWRAVVEELRRLDRRFDVVWCMGLDALRAAEAAGLDGSLLFVDADLESRKLAGQLASGGLAAGPRRWLASIDVGRWRRLERWGAATALFSTCSDAERSELGGRSFVVENSYSAVDPVDTVDPVQRPQADQDTLLFVGSLDYRPNIDGLVWFVTEVLGAVRRGRPEVRLRVVGGGAGADAVAGVDGVTLVGPVDDVGPELARAGAVVVPLLWGAGTRIKILEAFAHRVPVVSTTLGAEGLAVESGRELLIADDPEGFASACLAAVETSDETAARITRANGLFLDRYEESVVKHRLAAHVSTLLQERADGPGAGGRRTAR